MSNAESVSPLIVHLWCGPRSLSTCTMYSFAQRTDTKVVDEPLYAHWLHRNPAIHRPYRAELCTPDKIDGAKVLSDIAQTHEKKVVFLKQLPKQLVDLDDSVLFNGSNSKHVFLLRDPLEMIAAWDKVIDVHHEECSLETMGFPNFISLFSKIKKHTGQLPIVVNSSLLKQHPRIILSELCTRLGIEFQESMLSWPAGPKPDIDGLWAPFWYKSVHSYTSFNANHVNSDNQSYPTFTAAQIDLYRDALPFYQLLSRGAIGTDPLNPGSSVNTLLAGANSDAESKVVVDHGLKLTVGASGFSVGATQTLSDPRNASVLVWIGDQLVPREQAKVSVFDSAVQGGDAVWEGLRIYKGSVFRLQEHITRLLHSSKAMAFENVPKRAFIMNAVFKTLAANGMSDNSHIRLTLTRGPKVTSSMNPVFNVFGCNLIVLAEWKPVGNAATYDNNTGIMLISSSGRRNGPECVDSKIHHNNLINNILPKIQANNAGAADALMLDPEGFVSETNATNVFLVREGVVFTPRADFCLPGITRQVVIDICRRNNISIVEKRLSLVEFYTADEVFTTGTMGELTPVHTIDGRRIAPCDPVEGEVTYPMVKRLQEYYRTVTATEGYPLPF